MSDEDEYVKARVSEHEEVYDPALHCWRNSAGEIVRTDEDIAESRKAQDELIALGVPKRALEPVWSCTVPPNQYKKYAKWLNRDPATLSSRIRKRIRNLVLYDNSWLKPHSPEKAETYALIEEDLMEDDKCLPYDDWVATIRKRLSIRKWG